MDKKYEIKGIEKIIEKVGVENLAKYFNVGQDADFIALLTESIKERGVPSGWEVAGYEARSYEDIGYNKDKYWKELCEKYLKEGKAAIGLNYNFTNSDISELYFYIDEPVRDEELYGIGAAKIHLGGVSTMGLTMGKGFYEAHKDEISKFQEEYGKTADQEKDFQDYVKKYFDRLSGRSREEEEENYTFDWQRERAQKEKERMAGAESLISQLTNGKSIENVTLQELEIIKQGLIDRREKAKAVFIERFGAKDTEQDKE